MGPKFHPGSSRGTRAQLRAQASSHSCSFLPDLRSTKGFNNLVHLQIALQIWTDYSLLASLPSFLKKFQQPEQNGRVLIRFKGSSGGHRWSDWRSHGKEQGTHCLTFLNISCLPIQSRLPAWRLWISRMRTQMVDCGGKHILVWDKHMIYSLWQQCDDCVCSKNFLLYILYCTLECLVL